MTTEPVTAAELLDQVRSFPALFARKRDRVAALLDARPNWSSRRIARLAGVSHSLVCEIRREDYEHTEPRLGLDGRLRPATQNRPDQSKSEARTDGD